MTDGTPAPIEVAAPSVVEVEQITQAVDANDAIMDESGKIIQYLDREKNVTYKVKGSVNPFEAPAKDENEGLSPEEILIKNSMPKAAAGSEAIPPIVDPKAAEPTYLNQAEYVLRNAGYKNDEVDFGGEVGKVKISDLTPEQQIQVITTEYDTARTTSATKIKDLEARKPELTFEDPSAQQIVDYLKNGGDIKTLAKEILSKDPAAQAKLLSDDDVVKLSIKKEYPSFTDQEADEEFKDMTPAQVARRAKAIRSKMELEKPDYSNLTDKQKLDQKLAQEQEVASYNADVDLVKKTANEMKSIAGLPLTDDIRTFILSKVIPNNMEEDSEFYTDLRDNPKQVIELQFWKQYGERILNKTAEFYYKKGKEEGKSADEKLSDEPLRTYGTGAKGSKVKEVKTLADISMSDFLRNDGKF